MNLLCRACLAALFVPVLLLFPVRVATAEQNPLLHRVDALKITVLSTMLGGDAHAGLGEWGYSALVEADGRKILFDTGGRPEIVLQNARELGIDLSDVEEVVLSHNHWDHVGGLVELRRELQKTNPRAMSRVHVAEGIFLPRATPQGNEDNGLLAVREAYEATGGQFVVHSGPVELLPGVWLTGPVPRSHAENNYNAALRLSTSEGAVEDNVPEDASLVIDTPEGLVILTGCGHAGIINTAEFARAAVREAPLLAVVGGIHLFRADDQTVAWTAEQLRAFGLKYLLGGHCTGLEATYRIRQLAGLDRKTAVVSAVGSSFTLGMGIDPRALAR